MACGVAVKRSLELDSLLSPEATLKRRRTSVNAGAHCVPFRPAFSNSPPHHQQQPQQQQHHQQSSDFHQTSTSSAVTQNPSAFVSTQPKISSEELESFLMSEIHALRRRRLFANRHGDGEMYYGNGDRSPGGASSDSDSEQHMDSAPSAGGLSHGMIQSTPPYRAQHSSMRASPNMAHSDRPLFTYKQVRMICERLLKEQEARLRDEYDQVLNARLAEQYDTFVRFTYDQIHRRIDDSPMTYLS
jgi:hypothetical protein